MADESFDKAIRISPKEAASSAAAYYEAVTGDTLGQVFIEEVELSEDEKHWKVTLSHKDYTEHGSVLYGIQPAGRRFKSFVIDAMNGEVKSMKIKKI